MRNLIISLMKPVLRSPLHFVAGGNLLLLTFTATADGQTYTTSAEYRHDGEKFMLVVPKGRIWWNTLQGGVPITLRLHGEEINAVGEVLMLDKGAKFETLRWTYPNMPVEKLADMLSDVVVIRVHLPQTEAVPVL
jgi:hypothetical protein